MNKPEIEHDCPVPKRRFYTHGKLATIRNVLEAMKVDTDSFVWEDKNDQMVRHAAQQLGIKIRARKISKDEENQKMKPTTIGYRIWRVT